MYETDLDYPQRMHRTPRHCIALLCLFLSFEGSFFVLHFNPE